MARPTTYATPICLALSVLAAVGIILGLVTEEVMYPIGFLVPTVGYEAYRTEGASTRWASWAMVGLVVALIVLVVAGVDYDLRELLGSDRTSVGGQDIPLGDIKVVFPAAIGILAVLLITRTRGVYTRWLAGIIFVTSAAIVYLTAPEALGDLVERI